jgi:hypothetical protein
MASHQVSDQLADSQQIAQRSQRRYTGFTVAASGPRVGPGGWDQRFAAISQLQQQLQRAVAANLA